MISETESAILNALLELDSAVKGMATANPKPDLLALFNRIDDLTTRLPQDADPQLLHYLRKKSYEKARFWLEGRRTEIARGGCRND